MNYCLLVGGTENGEEEGSWCCIVSVSAPSPVDCEIAWRRSEDPSHSLESAGVPADAGHACDTCCT